MKLIIVLCLFVALSQGNVVTKQVANTQASISSDEDLIAEDVSTNPNLTNKTIQEEENKDMVTKKPINDTKKEEMTTQPAKELMTKLKTKLTAIKEEDDEKNQTVSSTQQPVTQKQTTKAPTKPESKNSKNSADNLVYRNYFTLITSFLVIFLLYVQF